MIPQVKQGSERRVPSPGMVSGEGCARPRVKGTGYPRWTDAELETVRQGALAGLSHKAIAGMLPHRTVAAVAQRAARVGVRRGVIGRPRHAWTPEALAEAAKMIAKHGLKETAHRLRKNPATIRVALNRAGIRAVATPEKWTQERLAEARALVRGHGLYEAARRLGRHPSTIYGALARHGRQA